MQVVEVGKDFQQENREGWSSGIQFWLDESASHRSSGRLPSNRE